MKIVLLDLFRRFSDSAGVIVREDDCPCVVPQDCLYHFSRVDAGLRQTAPEHFFEGDEPVLGVPRRELVTAQFLGDRVRQYHRLFLLPAVAHCGGSTGPSSIGGGMPEPPAAFRDADHHVVSAVIKWVEQGVAPERIIATRFSGNTLTLSRPLCPYPAQAVYNGSGDVNVASNFACVQQIESASSIVPGDIVQIKNSLTQPALELPNR